MKLFKKSQRGGVGSRQRLRPTAFDAASSPKVPFAHYYQGEADTGQSTRNLPKKSLKLWRLVIALGLLLALIFLLSSLFITKVTLSLDSSQLSIHSQSEYQDEVNKITGGLAYRFKPIFPADSLDKKLSNRFPEIKAVNTKLALIGQKAVVSISLAQPKLVLYSERGSYIIDDKGYVISTTDKLNATSASSLPRVSDQASYGVKLGQQVLSGQEVSFISECLKLLNQKAVTVSSAVLPPLARELDIETSEGYKVKFYTGGDPAVQVGALLAMRQKLQTENQKPSDYIDVRVEEKVFVK